jgi:hypothetical protein
VWLLDTKEPQERLDGAYWRMKATIRSLPATVALSDLADLAVTGRVPAQRDLYLFASVSRLNPLVSPKGKTVTQYATEELQELREGDLLISGIDLVHGSVGLVGPECEGMVVSKEYYILRPKPGIDAHWLAALLRTVRRIIEGTITGTSNRTRVESPAVLMNLRVPGAPSRAAQQTADDALREAHPRYRSASEAVREAERLALAP